MVARERSTEDVGSERFYAFSRTNPLLRAFIATVSKLTKWQEWALAMERSLEAVRRSRKLLSESFYLFDPHRPCEPLRRDISTDQWSHGRD